MMQGVTYLYQQRVTPPRVGRRYYREFLNLRGEEGPRFFSKKLKIFSAFRYARIHVQYTTNIKQRGDTRK